MVDRADKIYRDTYATKHTCIELSSETVLRDEHCEWIGPRLRIVIEKVTRHTIAIGQKVSETLTHA